MRKALLVIVAESLFAACADTRTLYECTSPDEQHVARFFHEMGGGAAGFAYEYVSLRPARTNATAEVPVLGLKHGYNARLTWRGRALRIEYPDSARVDLQSAIYVTQDRRDTVQLEYVRRPSRNGLIIDGPAGCVVEEGA